ncbi:uncharacterized protein STEHIDRAFT_150164 [Stereum hirsutum FP-91666 SS1]|uniref:uncharacterized protein n=1 Tax=Stereum hirsutum (strain FP-91666) TaxID=721885 RepID=UPI000444939A|nr:uncharacterized protein STEHIDRAFT_150164 [Stereum hirsutum FP-91666 SS1]EIM81148.1 hypothetical protein STEHIDRAFT_150164 [Stereum hirsutum FP-91666 SS1]
MSSDSNEPKGSGVIPTSAPQSYYPPTEITQSMQDMVEILREIRDRQVATDNAARQPMPAKSARSSSAWAPLIRSHMANVQPTVDRWRGALDTLLVFVSLVDLYIVRVNVILLICTQIALFSSILTTFVVQSLTSLSQDPGEKTNELLTNLTDIILAISNTSFSHLDIPHSVPFTPERDAVRLNFYWFPSPSSQ